MANYTTCPKCQARFDVTGAADGTSLVCDECGYEIVVQYETVNVIPGGLKVKSKTLADGSRWLDCPKCGLSSETTRMSPGNRFRCQRCNLLLQVPQMQKKTRRPTRALRGEDILTCPGCRTKYNISGYTPGNRFRCRSCGLSVTVPPRGDWTGSGEWEIDVEKGLLKCNRCGKSYPIASISADTKFECKACKRGFTPSHSLAQVSKRSADSAGARAKEWEIDVATGMVKCPTCRFSYDISNMKPGADFICPRCQIAFQMPAKVDAGHDREKVVCPKCNASYDVSGYLRGTMFTCSSCDAVIAVKASPGGASDPEKEVATQPKPQVKMTEAVAEQSLPAKTTQAVADAGPSESVKEEAKEDSLLDEITAAVEASKAESALDDTSLVVKTSKEEPAADDPTVNAGGDGKIVLVCSECSQRYKVPPLRDGRRRKCKLCSGILYEEGEKSASAEMPKDIDEVTDAHLERIAASVEVVEEIVVPLDPEVAALKKAFDKKPAAETDAHAIPKKKKTAAKATAEEPKEIPKKAKLIKKKKKKKAAQPQEPKPGLKKKVLKRKKSNREGKVASKKLRRKKKD